MRRFIMWIRSWRHHRGAESSGVTHARQRLDRVTADDSTVDRLVARRKELARENGLARDIEQALKARRA